MPAPKRALPSPTSPSPLRMRTYSPALSAVRTSPLSTGSLGSYPLTSFPFQSSPSLSLVGGAPGSPDLLEPFEYTPDMDPDLSRIDSESSARIAEDEGIPPLPPTARVLIPESPPRTLSRNQKTWVVFLGRKPGLYSDLFSASVQAHGFDGTSFHRVYPDLASATEAWEAYNRDGTFPGYGKAPWVVFLGKNQGVIFRVNELESSIKGYNRAIFRSYSSLTEANIKFQLFSKRIAEMFAGPDPFSHFDSPAPLAAGKDSLAQAPTTQATPTPSLSVPRRARPAPQIAESSKMALEHEDPTSVLAVSIRRHLKLASPGQTEGWFVAFNAVLPGVCCGSNELKSRGPKAGGFTCAKDEESANKLFLHLATGGLIAWAAE